MDEVKSTGVPAHTGARFAEMVIPVGTMTFILNHFDPLKNSISFVSMLKMVSPATGEIALRSAEVSLGIKTPLLVEETSTIAE